MSRPKNWSAPKALRRLKQGNRRYVDDKAKHPRQDSAARERWVETQEPHALVLTCADSRVIPELIFDVGLSEIFTVRVAGNVANTCSLASIEYAVAHLGINLIVVLGHQNCGAVKAALAGGDNGHNLNMLLAHLLPAVTGLCEDYDDDTKLRKAVERNAQLTAKAIWSRSPIISDVAPTILPAYYNLASGSVNFLAPE